jgi:hypothetical protein
MLRNTHSANNDTLHVAEYNLELRMSECQMLCSHLPGLAEVNRTNDIICIAPHLLQPARIKKPSSALYHNKIATPNFRARVAVVSNLLTVLRHYEIHSSYCSSSARPRACSASCMRTALRTLLCAANTPLITSMTSKYWMLSALYADRMLCICTLTAHQLQLLQVHFTATCERNVIASSRVTGIGTVATAHHEGTHCRHKSSESRQTAALKADARTSSKHI